MNFSLLDLPPKLRKKIRELPERHGLPGCWEWLGYVRPAKNRLRSIPPAADLPLGQKRRGRPRTRDAYVEVGKPTPMLHSPEAGHPVPAYQVLYARYLDVPLRRIPRLVRCPNPLCVHPQHVEPSLRIKPRTGPAHPSDLPGSQRTAHDAQQAKILEALCRARPAQSSTCATAAEEAGCGLPTQETLDRYKAWDREQPEEPDFDDD